MLLDITPRVNAISNLNLCIKIDKYLYKKRYTYLTVPVKLKHNFGYLCIFTASVIVLSDEHDLNTKVHENETQQECDERLKEK